MENKTYKIDDKRECQFMQLPKFLFNDDNYKEMSLGAKMLYTLLLDRVPISQQNGWVDVKGDTYIIFTREEASNELSISKHTTTQLFKELKRFNLIKEIRQGLTKANLLYVLTPKNLKFETKENLTQQDKKVDTIKNNKNKNNYSKKENLSVRQGDEGTDDFFLLKIKENCELDIFDADTKHMLEHAIERLFYSDNIKISGVPYTNAKLRSYLTNLNAQCLIRVVNKLRYIDTNVKYPINYVMNAIVNSMFETKIEELVDTI